jgi:hypothetical protein
MQRCHPDRYLQSKRSTILVRQNTSHVPHNYYSVIYRTPSTWLSLVAVTLWLCQPLRAGLDRWQEISLSTKHDKTQRQTRTTMAGAIDPCGCSPPIVYSVRLLKRRDSRVTRRRSNFCFQTHTATNSNDETRACFLTRHRVASIYFHFSISV